MTILGPEDFGRCVFTSDTTALVELSDSDADTTPTNPRPMTAKSLLEFMRTRLQYYGSPLPEGFVVPPGIDIDELLKLVPWPEPRTE